MITARLSFNTNGWVNPSGSVGKSKSKTTFEFKNGFGFEEWLFNNSYSYIDKNGDKWNFGYIEGIHKNYKSGDEEDSLQLFTINAKTKNRYIVAEIKEWKKIYQNDSTDIIKQHPQMIAQMREDLEIFNNINALAKFNEHHDNHGNDQLFNIIYKDFTYCDLNHLLADKNNHIYNLHRFFLYK